MIDCKKFVDFLPKEDFDTCVRIIEEGSWKFIGRSNDNDFKFFYMDLMNEDFFTEKFFNHIKNVIGDNYVIDRVYANGQTHGLCGSLHQDSTEDNAYTFLFYSNPTWNIQWGGDTIFWENENENCVVSYRPNMGVFFKGDVLHAGMEPTRHCTELRTTVAFKLSLVK